ncbi:LOW QUALITY PROTEIN: (E2-independent) E3 ubiquitin-conjugating enzyme FATS [Pyxicephalus adspersus]|uniref:LOW QUALITY PROTEIN: (E2-independent) E3 ubiquitin-conjugating enzyme FATS n=1 Tax=Pyxicephalus adspersus TaxID=30357 RepID=UPI003B5CBADC
MPSQERIPIFLNNFMDLDLTNSKKRMSTAKTFVSQVHLSVYYSIKKEACFFGLQECNENSGHKKQDQGQAEYYRKMIDKSDTEEGKRLDPTHCIITSPSTTCCLMKTSLAIHNSVRMKRTFTPLPITLKHQNSLDKTLHKAALHPSKEEFRPTQKKGFSSITITARRYIASLSHAPKEIITDPASFLCRSNDLIMKASVPSDEHDLQCRYLDRPEYYTRASEPCGFLHSQELPQQPRTTLKYVNAIHKKNSRTFISGIHIKKADMFARSIYYIDKSFFLPLGQVANPEIYKSTMSFKIQPRPGKPITKNGCESLRLPAYTLCQYLTMPAMEGNNKCKKDQTHSPKPIPETQCTKYLTMPAMEGNNKCKKDQTHSPKPIPETQCTKYKCTKYKENQEDQQNAHNPEACQDISSYVNKKAFGLSQTLEQDSQPVCEIYVRKDHPPKDVGNLGPERPTATTFTFIFGKQIGKLKNKKQNLSTEKILAGKNMPLSEISKDNKSKDLSQAIMSLQEALKYYRPDFICNSQGRVHKLEVMARLRKTQNQEAPNSRLSAKQIHLKKKVFTVPHPLSDNLFKPKERAISEREMQQRSRRIYNSLPEVRKKKEQEEKRILTQSNRLRAQIFKKKLLDQILQRSSQ